jgi:osmotically-inducible protein OsmY
MWDTEVPDKAIKVRVEDHWMWLIGEVGWHFERLAAERAVENIAGVKGVTNLIRIKRQPSDPNVQAHIEAAMRREPLLAARTVAAKVRGGCVELSGTLQSLAECDAARHVAWSAPGISKVEDRFEIVS